MFDNLVKGSYAAKSCALSESLRELRRSREKLRKRLVKTYDDI